MSDDNKQDAGEQSPASDGSVAGEPVAWAVMVGGERMYVSWCKEMCEDEAYYHRHPLGDSVLVVPLYRSPTLTDAEREAVGRAIKTLDDWQSIGGYHELHDDDAATLRGLLERLGGGD